jgi:hypothetical protein
MTCTIEWNTLDAARWHDLFVRIPRSNLLQYPPYLKAAAAKDRQKIRFGHILINGQSAGLVSLLEAGIVWNALHAVILDRGPLWLPGFGGAAHIKMFFDEWNRQLPSRFGRRRRVLPEVADGAAARKIIGGTGMACRPDRTGYETFWVDLTPDEDTRRAALKSNWRNKLNKSERAGITVHWDASGRLTPWVLSHYAADKAARGYPGPTPLLLAHLAREMTPSGDMIVGQAVSGGAPVAGVMLVRHGRSATYLVGWSDEAGRDTAAHHLLLWQGANMLKEKGVMELDLGGINDDSAQGVKIFKEGMGGQLFTGVGHYI